jgi:hypothetical protein
MKKEIDKKLYQQAEKIVRRREEYNYKAEVREVYNELVHDSERRAITAEERKELKDCYEKMCKVKIRGMGDAHIAPDIRSKISELLKEGIAHPKEIKEQISRAKDRWRNEQNYSK